MIVEQIALALRRVMLRTSRSPLKTLWAAMYGAVARLVALVVAPGGTGTSAYVTGSLASGDLAYGLSDIDLVAVAADESESRRARRRFDNICRALPPLRQLMPDFSTYDAAGLARVLGGSYLTNGIDEGTAVFLGPDAVRDQKGLLERPGLYGERDWRRLRGPSRLVHAPAKHDPLVAAWLELQYRWQWAFHAPRTEAGAQRLASTLIVEAARIWLWLARGERHESARVPIDRALSLIGGESDALLHALRAEWSRDRPATLRVKTLHALFVRISDAIAGLVDERAAGAGVTQVDLPGAEGGDPGEDGLPLLDWRALALPVLDWSIPELPRVVEERLVLPDGDPADPATLTAAAARGAPGRVTALRRGALLIEPTTDVLGRGRLRAAQCSASDPVSMALLDGRTHAAFPEIPGWSARDWARRAVAEHRAWLRGGRHKTTSPHRWVGAWPAMVSASPATLGLLLSAARSALFLESIEKGAPELPLTFADTVPALIALDPGAGADAAEACAALEESNREQRQPPHDLVEGFRRQVESFPAYATGESARTVPVRATRETTISITPAPGPDPPDGHRFRIRRGTNISHWLSRTWWMTEEERCRKFSRDDALRIRELGLDHVRLPVDEHRLWHADGRRDRRGFDLLSTTIEWCGEAGLAVILSLHALRSHRYLRPAPGLFEPHGSAVLADLWRDLSDALAGLPVEALAYELLGEPTAPDDDQWNRIAAKSIAAIREQEPERTIVLGSNRQNSYWAFASLSVPDDPHLILSFHYYEPTLLTHYRAPWLRHHGVYRGLDRISRRYDGARIRKDISLPVSVAERSGQPLHCGEFGVMRTVPDELRLRWYRDVIDALEENGIAWSTWALRGKFGLYSGDSPTIAHHAIAERRFTD